MSDQNIKSYIWVETEYPRNSNSIASAVYDTLVNFNFGQHTEPVSLFGDSCGGQNKNTSMMSMLAYWLGYEAPVHIKKVQLIFPIVGHSFLPPDRVFGLIERELKNQTIIIKKGQEYENIIKKYSKIMQLGEDWRIFDWKSACNEVVKKPGQLHFQFNLSKRFIFERDSNHKVVVRGETFYISDLGVGKTITNKGKNLFFLKPKVIEIRNSLKGDKSTINRLL